MKDLALTPNQILSMKAKKWEKNFEKDILEIKHINKKEAKNRSIISLPE